MDEIRCVKFMAKENKTVQSEFRCRLAVVAVTSCCPLNCVNCYARRSNQRKDLSLDDLLKIIKEMRKIGVERLVVSGGEPLSCMNRTLSCITLAKRLGMRVTLTTSGMGMNSIVLKQLADSLVDTIQFSLDGPNREYNAITRGKSFDQVVLAIKQAVDFGLPVSAMMVVHRRNIGQMFKWVDFITCLGVRSAVFDRLCVYEDYTKDMALGPEELKKFHDSFLRIRQNRNLGIYCNDPLLFAREFKDKGVRGDWDALPLYGCTAGIDSIYMDAGGIIFPCTKLRLAAGDVCESSVRKIWQNSTLLLKLRHRLENLRCKEDCLYWKICGGCRAQAYETGIDVFSPDPACYL